ATAKPVEWTVHRLPTVQADPALLELVLRELLSNSLMFSSGEETTRIEIGAEETEDEYIVYVRDNGVGFDQDDIERIFTAYAREETGSRNSMGVGLAIVRRAMLRLHGRVWAEGQIGSGATFFIALPRQPSLGGLTA